MPGLNRNTAYKTKTQMTNKYYSQCLDLLVYFLHEQGVVNFLEEEYSLIGFGVGANTAVYYALE